MAISVGDAILKIKGDTKDLDQSLKDTQSKVKSSMDKMRKAMMPVGLAFTAIGVAGLKMVDSARKMNAQLGVTALNLGVTTKEMRDLALETTNVTFPLKEVTATFDLLARAGVDNTEIMKEVATAFDTLGDAIGVPASIVTEKLIPTMKTFNLTAGETADKTDALTWLFRNTTVSLDDFNRMVGYVTPDLVKMGLTTEDMIAILADLEDQGYSGEVMTREFRKAVTQATKDQIPLNEALGISTDKIESYKVELDGATGLTQEYADVANEQYGIMDKVRQRFDELVLSAGTFLEPLEPILAGMTALGPLMIFLSTSIGAATISWIAHTTALIAAKVAALLHIPVLWGLVTALWAQVTATLAAIAATGYGIPIAIGAAAAIATLATGIWLLVDRQKKQYEATEEVAETTDGLTESTQEATAAFDSEIYVLNKTTGAMELYVEATEELTKETDKAIDKQRELMGLLGKLYPKGIPEAEWKLLAPLMERKPIGALKGYEPGTAGWYKALGYTGYQVGGVISKPTLALLGEQAPGVKEYVFNERQLGMLGGYRTANIYMVMDGRIVARAIGQPLVDEIRLKTGAKL